MQLSGTASFVVLMAGVLGTYCEFLRPGTVVPLVLGSTLLVIGGWNLVHCCPPSSLSALLVATAVLLWMLELWRSTYFLAPSAATAAFILGTVQLCGDHASMSRPTVVTVASGMSLLTSYLAYVGRRAKHNKVRDV